MWQPESIEGGSASDELTPFPARIDKAQQGDQSTAGRLLEENRGWLERKAHRLLPAGLHPRYDSADLAQDCLTSAAQNLPKFRGRRSAAFRGWLATILRNRIAALVRGNAVVPQALPADAHGQELVADSISTALSRFARQETIALLRAALAELSSDDRRVIVAHYLDGLTYAELSSQWDRDVATLRQQAHRALRRLAEGMELLSAMDNSAMPLHYRHALCASRLRGRSIAQIAAELEIGERAASTFVRHAVAWLRMRGGTR